MGTERLPRICSLENCDRTITSRGMCDKHYRRVLKHGDPRKVLKRFGRGKTAEDRFWSRVDKTSHPDGCWIWQGAYFATGYGQVVIERGGNPQLAHRASWFFTFGYMPDDCLCHRCDNKQCVNPLHLWEGSQLDNVADRQAKRRQAKGTDFSSRTILTDDDIREIRKRYAAGETSIELAETFKVVPGTIGHIVAGRTWKHVK